MNVYSEFFLKFMEPFFGGIANLFKALGQALLEIFNIMTYIDIIKDYKSELSGAGMALMILAILCLVALFAILIFLIYKGIKIFIRYRQKLAHQNSLVDEIENLNNEVIKLKNENQKFLTMSDPLQGEVEYDEEGNIINRLKEGESRFFRLTQVDQTFNEFVPAEFVQNITLDKLCEQFRNFAASKMGLYYRIELIRLFIAAFASNRLIILQGISGTGKTSLAYAFGNFIKNDAVIASVQPSWRDSTEIFGYFNEFTKRFNETEILTKMYEAKYNNLIYLTLLDEMNISRVEYYFAEMLSVLELPSQKEWIINLVTNVWDNDPKLLEDGKLRIPTNMWYIGTINNDDSTFMITDKVYDRAMPINIDEKGHQFEAPDTEALDITSEYFVALLSKAKENHAVSQETLDKIAKMDDYAINHFRLAFGNRIVKQIKEFVPAYVACGGNEIEAIDYVIAHKILRKFDQLNLSYIRNEIPGFEQFLDMTFGIGVMKECKAYLERLKKTI